MEAAGQTGGGGGGGGGGGSGGPAPFLVKTYEMVDDSSTDDIVSWSDTNASFVVWNHPDFAARLLPTYFKHNNFSSFIRQLNTYGFRKIDPERWEFANEDFVKGQKHLLKNIHRRKPIHSHSHPPGAAGGLPDAERAALEDEIDRLTREKAALQADLLRFRQHQPRQRAELDELDVRLRAMELRQERMIAFLHRALQSPAFMENLVRMAGADPTDFSAIHKKRRLPPSGDSCEEAPETAFFDNHSSTSKPEIGHLFRRDFSDKLKLELSTAFSDCNLVSASTQSSNEEDGSPQGRQPEVGANLRMECLSLVPDALELSDTGTTFCPKKNVLCPRSVDDGNGFIPCHLSLTLASTSMQMDTIYHSPSADPNLGDQGPSDSIDHMTSTKDGVEDSGGNTEDANVPSQQDMTRSSNQAPVAPQGRVNDVFWEQFLTERPGSSDTEEASSTLRVNSCEERQEERKEGYEGIWRNREDMEQLAL